MAEPYSIFISYAHEDERFKDQLVQHLAGINRQRLIASWVIGVRVTFLGHVP